MFEEDLHGVYREILFLCSNLNFSPEYVEVLTPVERKLYKNYYIEDKKRTEQPSEGVNIYGEPPLDLPNDKMQPMQ